MGKMFGTSGIRGLTLIDITPQLAERIGRAFGNFLGNSGLVVIGRDTRFGAEVIEHAIIAGLTGSGIDIAKCGVVPTPALAHYIDYIGAIGAVMITGSHTPPDRIGIIPMLQDSQYIYGEDAKKIEELYIEFSDPQAGYVTELENVGTVGEAVDAFNAYTDFLLSLVDVNLLKSKSFRIVVDPVNGAASQYVPELLRGLGHEIITIHDQPSGKPGRKSEPRPWTLEGTAKLVSDIHADLGIAFDIDGDRVLFIDEYGTVVSTDVIGAILMEEILKINPGPIALPINTSGLAERVIGKYKPKAKAIYCPIGQPGTIAKAKEVKAVFAYEESGKYYFTGENILWTDAPLSALRILEILLREKISLNELVNHYPRFYTKTINLTASQGNINLIAEKALKAWHQLEPDIEITQEMEMSGGTRQNYKDNSWLLLRPSGTEPLIRVVADSPSEARTNALVELGHRLVMEAMKKEH